MGRIQGKNRDGKEFKVSTHILDFPCDLAGTESASKVGDLDSIPGLERSLEKGMATHFSILASRIPWTV